MLPLLVVAPAMGASVWFGFGADLTLTGVDGRARLGFGLHLAAQVRPWENHQFCEASLAPTAGAVVQRRWLDPEHRRWMFGVRSGATLGRTLSWMHANDASIEAELGVSLSAPRGSRLYVGGQSTVLGFFGAGFDVEPGPAPASLPTGYATLQLPWLPGSGTCIDGRPLRHGRVRLLPRVLHARDAAPRWIATGREELASVGTFLRLAAELEALAAPRALVARARAAAREELGHAAMCFGMAGGAIAQLPPCSPRRFPSSEAAGRTLVAEALVDGVGNENTAADGALAARDAARDDAEARVWDRIAIEERGHARLGEDLARWGGAPDGWGSWRPRRAQPGCLAPRRDAIRIRGGLVDHHGA